jgi:hypothetical protein
MASASDQEDRSQSPDPRSDDDQSGNERSNQEHGEQRSDNENYKRRDRPIERKGRSPSKRRLSSIDKDDDDELTINPKEIDELITSWYEAKTRRKELELKESKYKRMIHKILNLTGHDAIKGRDLMVTRKHQKRRIITKNLLPADIFAKYARTTEISFLYLKEL